MSPTIDKVYTDAYQPYADSKIDFDEALEARRGADARLHAEADAPDRPAAVRQAARKLPPSVKAADVPFKVLVPAFVTSELKTAFQIGFLIFIPFLIIDMIVASVLMSMGMMMLSPVLIALPFKLMLFVLADGWNLLLGSLAPRASSPEPARFQPWTSATGLHLRPAGLYMLLMSPRRCCSWCSSSASSSASSRRRRRSTRRRCRSCRRCRRGRRAGDRRAVDADVAGRVPAAHAAVDSLSRRSASARRARCSRFTEAQVLAWVRRCSGRSCASLALFSALPVLGQRSVPMRVRIGSRS